MSKFFDRLTGKFEKTDMMIYTFIDKFYTSSKQGYKKCYIQFTRGDLVERSE